MTPQQLLSGYTWRSGACWRCEWTALVAEVGEWCSPTESLPLTACALCVVRMDQLAAAARDRAARRKGSIARSLPPTSWPEHHEAGLRAWLDALMEPVLGHDGTATGVYVVRGSQQVTTQRAC